MNTVLESLNTPWEARLELTFDRRGETTRLIRRLHHGPLYIQKPLYPEGPVLCHTVVLHPPAGIAGGDELQIDIDIGARAQVLLTTPGAGKWYRAAETSHPWAKQSVVLKVGIDGTAEWLPQESIVFAGARAKMHLKIELARGARYLGLDTLCLGRRARGESFSYGCLQLASDIRLDGKPLWRERGCIEGGSALLDSPIGLAGFSLCSTLIAAGTDIDGETMSVCRKVAPKELNARCGVTAMPQLFVGRYLGHSSEAARQWFVELWRALRPIYIGREVSVPRIWNT